MVWNLVTAIKICSQILQNMNLQTFIYFFAPWEKGNQFTCKYKKCHQYLLGSDSSKQSQEPHISGNAASILFLLFPPPLYLSAKPFVTTVRWIKSVSLKWLEMGINWNCLCWEVAWDRMEASGKGGLEQGTAQLTGCVPAVCVLQTTASKAEPPAES